MSDRFCTLEREVEITGIGLHCGQMIRARFKPTERVGVRFTRSDLPASPWVPADLAFVTATTHATTLQRGEARVQTVEHLLAALWSQGLTHVEVELDGPEVPILDGSALGWLELLQRAGRVQLDAKRPLARLRKAVWLEGERGAHMLGFALSEEPEATFRLSVAVDFGVAGTKTQFDGEINAASFARELAPARTFTLEPWLEPLRTAGLIRGGSLDNAVLIGRDGTWSSPPRAPDELARHKGLDVVGDLALALCSTGARFGGHIVAIRAGHGTHRDWAARALQSGALELD